MVNYFLTQKKNIYKLSVSEALVELSLYFGNERKTNRRLTLFNRYDCEMDSISSVCPLVNIFGKVEILIGGCSSLRKSLDSSHY